MLQKRLMYGVFAVIALFLLLTASTHGAPPYSPNIRLLVDLPKKEYYPREPIVLRVRLRNDTPIPLSIGEIDWEHELFFDFYSKRGDEKKVWENFPLRRLGCVGPYVGGGMTPEEMGIVVGSFILQPASEVCSHTFNLCSVVGPIERNYIHDDSWSVFRGEKLHVVVKLDVSWYINRHVNGVKTVTATFNIDIKEPTNQREKDALRLMDLYDVDEPTEDDRNLLLRHRIPVVDNRIDWERIYGYEYLLILRDSFPESIYSAEASFECARILSYLDREDEAEEAYQWIIDNHPDSWWAHLAQKALEELQK